MRFLTDENTARSTVVFLRFLGHDVKDVKEERWIGKSDQELAKIAKHQKRIILSLDKDFGNVLVFPPRMQQGILLIDIKRSIPSVVNDLLLDFLKNKKANFFHRKLVVLDEWHVRIRE